MKAKWSYIIFITLIVAHVTDLEGPADKLYPGFLYELTQFLIMCKMSGKNTILYLCKFLYKNITIMYIFMKSKKISQELKDSKQNTLHSFYLNLAGSNHPINVIFTFHQIRTIYCQN